MVFSSASATSSNIALLSANTNVSTQESCNNNQVINSSSIKVNIGTINCQTLLVGNLTATSKATCNQYAEIAVMAKVLADQVANSESSASLLGFAEQALANATNFVQVQNNVSALLAASCTNSQKVNIGERSFTAGVISGETCEIFNGAFSQEASCLQTLKADITNTTEVSQTATAKATAGLDLGQLILFLLLLFGGGALLAIFGALLKAIITGGGRAVAKSESSGLFGSGGLSISELTAKKNGLLNIVKQRDRAAQSLQTFVNRIQTPPRL
jgi:hypothetical protein